ncbi:histidine kinase [Pseudomonas sp. HMWF032]|uniref:HDOD domain-containing protein n=1 Tax=unclassified Pseudomonas TaxID=196821 RepID=UPI000D360123|nr:MULTISPECIES: HDOD domain-containing protein [unclassified Pseudomonas]PTS86953.1 histidine kinase [Pseudomonas sp. HMWF032]PTT86020.1 histidine kinase [Pseudomonas sp. HMWF010]WAC46738.1 HDOD domain-containing protein [Pseudomonas sp. SL4(2022)]
MQSWIDRFNQAELPALATVVHDLHRLTQGHTSSVQQLADVLLRDAALTTKVLRVGNSVFYNPSQEPIRTISRAIVLIGFDNVRQIGLSISLIDGLLARSSREQLAELLAQSFHAAVQARNIAGYVLTRSDEEVFIAALLHNVGELAFWGCAGEVADELASALAQPGVNADEVVMSVLGSSFRQMSLALVKSWNLGDTLSLALQSSSQHDPAGKAVALGAKISQVALEGWDSPAMDALVGQLAGFIGVSPQEAMQQVLASAEETVAMAATFGVGQLGKLIPNTDPEQIRLQQEQRKARLLQPDLLILQQALQDLGLLVSRRADLGLVLDTLFKGLHQGAGLERIMLVVLADGQSCFRCKRVIGEGTGGWAHDFILPVEQAEQPHIFSYALRNKEALWMGVPASYNLNELVTQPIRQRLGQGMFFIAPLLAGTREIGLLYADSRVSGRALKHEQFVAFQRFTQLTGRCLDAMSKKA